MSRFSRLTPVRPGATMRARPAALGAVVPRFWTMVARPVVYGASTEGVRVTSDHLPRSPTGEAAVGALLPVAPRAALRRARTCRARLRTAAPTRRRARRPRLERGGLVAALCVALPVLALPREADPTLPARPRPNRAEAEAPPSPTIPAALPLRVQRFAWQGRLGPVGHGQRMVGLETLERTPLVAEPAEPDTVGTDTAGTPAAEGAGRATQPSSATGTRTRIVEQRDIVVENTGDPRHQTRRAQWTARGVRLEYEYRAPLGGARTPERRLTVTVTGDRIAHRNEGIGPTTSPRMPTRMSDPWLLEEDFVSSFQLAFERLLRDRTVEALDGVTFQAIIPARLGLFPFEVRRVGPARLALPTGPLDTVEFEVTRLEVRRDGTPLSRQLALRRRFWLTAEGRIARFVLPRQPRFQGRVEGYDLGFWPQYAGAAGRAGDDEGSASYPGLGEGRRPASLIIDDGSPGCRTVAHATAWALAARGVRAVVLEPTTAGANDAGTPRGAGAATARQAVSAARARTTLASLGERGDVDPERVFVAWVGGAVSLLAAEDPARTTAGEGASPSADIPAAPPAGFISVDAWPAEGEDDAARAELARALRRGPRHLVVLGAVPDRVAADRACTAEGWCRELAGGQRAEASPPLTVVRVAVGSPGDPARAAPDDVAGGAAHGLPRDYLASLVRFVRGERLRDRKGAGDAR